MLRWKDSQKMHIYFPVLSFSDSLSARCPGGSGWSWWRSGSVWPSVPGHLRQDLAPRLRRHLHPGREDNLHPGLLPRRPGPWCLLLGWWCHHSLHHQVTSYWSIHQDLLLVNTSRPLNRSQTMTWITQSCCDKKIKLFIANILNNSSLIVSVAFIWKSSFKIITALAAVSWVKCQLSSLIVSKYFS